ncbi:hypothetical protein [Gottfriedia acidiceleris]|uniref:Uncharacterized protein n=1 Tax=Gottfriedia acidiceleris TaxID=371036 RepID=A0ABY4JQG1_9BACI|nr:hypothetical protein [Gottfriedia acidiceleris]UPM54530.1 hypothetical protein MY490_01080 [Gottfriedia acidiceleris]
MEINELIYGTIEERMNHILNTSWSVFIAHCLEGRAILNKEASFQHHFANILQRVGSLYCFSKKEIFHVDLEYTVKKQVGFVRKAEIDIICELVNFENNNGVKAAIELKHTIKPGDATDIGRINSYQDIYRLEKLKELEHEGFSICKFYMLANRVAYTNISPPNTSGEDFPTYRGYTIEPKKVYKTIHSKVGKDIELIFNNSYKFNWDIYEQPKRLYFLSVDV